MKLPIISSVTFIRESPPGGRGIQIALYEEGRKAGHFLFFKARRTPAIANLLASVLEMFEQLSAYSKQPSSIDFLPLKTFLER